MIYKPYKKILNYKNHILIAGTTGSGKSVLLNGLIHTGLQLPNTQFMFVDTKKVELNLYKNLQKTYYYTDSIVDIPDAFSSVVKLMNNRLTTMQKNHQRNWTGNTIYIVIDEFCDIVYNCKSALNQISLIAALGRAAGIVLIIATQRPTSDIITPLIKANTPIKIGLRTASKQESRNIIYTDDCFHLPLCGESLVIVPDSTDVLQLTIPLIPDAEIYRLINTI